MSSVFCASRRPLPRLGFSIFKVKVITPDLPCSQDYSEEQMEKPFEEPELRSQLHLGSDPSFATYCAFSSQIEPSSVKRK